MRHLSVGKVCIILCGENPCKNVDFCREGLTQVNTAVRAVRYADNRLAGFNIGAVATPWNVAVIYQLFKL